MQQHTITYNHFVKCAASSNGCGSMLIWKDNMHDLNYAFLTQNKWRIDGGKWICGLHQEKTETKTSADDIYRIIRSRVDDIFKSGDPVVRQATRYGTQVLHLLDEGLMEDATQVLIAWRSFIDQLKETPRYLDALAAYNYAVIKT